MIISAHAKDKYALRIKNISDVLTRKQWIVQNEVHIEEHINKLFQYAELVFVGDLKDGNGTREYYLSGTTALVCTSSNNEVTVVTLFNIRFPFPEELNEIVVQKLSKTISDLSYKIDESRNLFEESVTTASTKIAVIEAKIEQQKLILDNLELEKTNIKNSNKIQENELAELIVTQKAYAEQLFANTDMKIYDKGKK